MSNTPDSLWGKLIHRMFTRCAVCASYEPLHAHHIETRSHKSMRWAPENGIGLCHDCHRWAHSFSNYFWQWLLEQRPDQAAWVAENRKIPPAPIGDTQPYIDALQDLHKAMDMGLEPVWRNGQLYLE